MKISIVTTAFNSGATLRDTIKSVLSQKYDDWQHIIVDGASSDDTIDIIKEFEPAYKGRLKWISEPDKGIYDAMNKGIAMADGDVVGILNSDDFYSSIFILSKVAENFMADQTLDAVYGDIHYVNDNDLSKCVRYYSSRFFRRWMMLMGYQPAHPSFYCRKEIYDKYGNFDTDFKVAADFEHLLRLIYLHKIKTKYLNIDFVTMRVGGASTSGLQSHKKIIEDHQNSFKKNKISVGKYTDFLRYPIKLMEVLVSRIFPRQLFFLTHGDNSNFRNDFKRSE